MGAPDICFLAVSLSTLGCGLTGSYRCKAEVGSSAAIGAIGLLQSCSSFGISGEATFQSNSVYFTRIFHSRGIRPLPEARVHRSFVAAT